MIPSHDLKDIRDRFDKGFESLKEVLRLLKESYADFEKRDTPCKSRDTPCEACDTREACLKLKAQAKDWLDQCKDFQERLPKRLPPFVRDDLWGKREIGKGVQIRFKLKKGVPLKRLNQGLRKPVKAAGGRASWSLPSSLVTADAFTEPGLAAHWPDPEAIEKEVADAFKTYATLAEERPEDFRLKPRKTEEVVAIMVEVLLPLETVSRKRMEKQWPDGSGAQYYASLLADEGLVEPGEPMTGATSENLFGELRDRWPCISGDQINNGIVDTFQKGLIRIFGGEAAHKEGYAPEKIGEIVNDVQLERLLTLKRTQRPFEIIFKLRTDGTGQTKDMTAAGADTTLSQKAAPTQTMVAMKTSTDTPELMCSVELGGEDNPPIVFGKTKPLLNSAPYAVLKVLVEAFPGRMGGAQIDRKSGRSDSRRILRALRTNDSDWERAILMAERSGRGYGLAGMP